MASTFMPQHHREKAFGIITRQGESVSVADAGIRDLDEHLALARRFDINLDDLQRLPRAKGHGGT